MEENQATDIMEVLTRRTGRRSKCTPEIIEEIGYNVAMGLSHKDAATLSGIDRSSLYNWMKKGREEFERVEGDRTSVLPNLLNFFDFFNTLEKAVPLRKVEMMKQIVAHGRTNWQALAWMLERQYPDEYARRTKVEITDWRSEIIDLIKQGLDFNVIAESLGEKETRKLFVKAGVEVT